jgi:hypothetical protein
MALDNSVLNDALVKNLRLAFSEEHKCRIWVDTCTNEEASFIICGAVGSHDDGTRLSVLGTQDGFNSASLVSVSVISYLFVLTVSKLD